MLCVRNESFAPDLKGQIVEPWVQTECSKEDEQQGLLQVIYEDGKFYNQTTLNEVRERLKNI